MNRLIKILLGTEAKKIALSFLIVILTGSILLSLPISQKASSTATYFDHLFTSVSMVCVTGLSVLSVKDTYSPFGQIIGIILMQIGGLSLMTFMYVSIVYMKKRLSLKSQYLFQSTINRSTNEDLRDFLRFMLISTVFVEFMIFIILSTQFIPERGWSQGLFDSFFISVSAFNNAGFDNLGTTSLMNYHNNSIVLLSVAFSIIFAGLGFSVWYELTVLFKHYFSNKPFRLKLFFRSLSIHAKSVILTTLTILIMGTVVSWLIERNNPQSIGNFSLYDQWVNSFFHTVSMRTAGFSAFDFTQTKSATNFIYLIQMVIGGSPGGTAGGIKITTFIIIMMYLKAELKGNSFITLFKRTISLDLFRRAISVLAFYMFTLLIGFFLLLLIHPELNAFHLFFESVSALSTVGVSANMTGQLSRAGHWVIIALMFLGRVGPLTVFVSLTLKQENKDDVEHAQADLLIG